MLYPRLPFPRWLSVLASMLFLLVMPPSLDVRAQMGTHTHNWSVDPLMPEPGVHVTNDSPYPAEIIQVNIAPTPSIDNDTCQNANCSFVDATSYNGMQKVAWSASRGQFGYLDGNGQFVASGDVNSISHYKAPSSTGEVILSLRVDDTLEVTDPGTGQTITTADDPQTTGSRTITVVPNPNAPTWYPDTEIQCAGIASPSAGAAVTGGSQVSCSAATATDQDKKVDPYTGTSFEADTCTYTWTATGGSFLNGVNTGQNVTWIAPTYPEPAVVTLTLQVDDQNDANRPEGENGNRDDPAREFSITITVTGLPTVSITATDALASEPGTDTGTFAVTRTGSTLDALTVYYQRSGTASSGADYLGLPGSVTIAAGSSSATLPVTPVDDLQPEVTETLILTLRPTPNYAVGTPSSAAVNILDNDGNVPPAVVITSPAEDASFPTSATITIEADASDPDGSVAKVEFFQNDVLLGEDTTEPYSYTWSNVAAGNYTLVARATDNLGATAESLPVAIAVGPAVQIQATDPTAAEPGIDTGTFTVTRSGSTTDPLTVNYDIEGTATNGTDYLSLPGSVTIPAGSSAATIGVTPLDDTQVEGSESVSLFLASGQGYSIGTQNAATVTILDNDTNRPPTVAITAPTEGATFSEPAAISIQATAADPDGSVTKVEFFQNDSLLGEDTTSPYTFTWSSVVAGDYTLLARAVDNLGAAAFSLPVNITVAPAAGPMVQIEFPSRQPVPKFKRGLPIIVKGKVTGATHPTTVSIYVNHNDGTGDHFKGTCKVAATTATTGTWKFWRWDTSGSARGTHTIKAVATDAQNRTSPAARVDVRLFQMIWPVSGRQTPDGGYFGDPRPGRTHAGFDILTTSTTRNADGSWPRGEEIHAAESGTVSAQRTQREGGVIVGAGHYRVIEHGTVYVKLEDGERTLYTQATIITRYFHLYNNPSAPAGDSFLNQGMTVGHEGHTGRSACNHLHFEVHVDGVPVDPQEYLPEN
jgi:murein DD-endopeptidase MepM/ murein hydrolase activator NlpD